jgi:hypothetical protein
LIEGLKEAGLAVKLEHDDKETSWDNHGAVSVCTEDGTELASSPDVQVARGKGGKKRKEKINKEDHGKREREEAARRK